MHHIFVHQGEKLTWRGDACDETSICNIFAEYRIPHSHYSQIMCGASEHAFQIRLPEKSVAVFHDRFMPEFPEDAFIHFLESENLHEFLAAWRKK